MELTIRVPELMKALQRVQGIVEKKTTMPILANALIKSKGKDKITVSATDLEIGLTADYDASITKTGAMTLGAKALYDIVRSLPEDEVTLKQASNQWVEITCGKVKYRVVGMAAESFPTLPTFDEVGFFSLEPKVFREMIEKTLYAVSTDETRYNLTGVYCEAVAGSPGLRMVATDGHRLSVIERPTNEAPTMREGVIIPRKGLVELRKLLEDGDEGGQLGFVENSAVFEKGGITLTMRLVDGKFPDYQQVIPTASSRRVHVPRQKLLAALKRTSLLSPDKAQGVRLDLTENTLALMANNPDLGEAREELDVKYAGEALKIGFNFRYVIDVLSVLGEDEVELELTDELSPGVIRGVGSEGYRAVIMPMKDLAHAPSALVRFLTADLSDFRNIETSHLELSPSFTAIIGPNGQGKTNALEALYVIAALRPLRSVPRRALIRTGAELATVAATVASGTSGLTHEMRYEIRGGSRLLEKDGNRCQTESFLGTAVAVAFTPDDLQLAKGGPDRRRRFLDRALLNIRPAYLERALRYSKAVRDRNRLLVENGPDDLVDAFDQIILAEGTAITVERARYVEQLAPLVRNHFERIAAPAPQPQIRYVTTLGDADQTSADATEAAFAEKLQAGRPKDRRRKTTSVGPHLDDLELTLNEAPAKERASQGQHRALVLAIKLAEISHLAEQLGEPPILLLDDMSSELDVDRSKQLFDSVGELEGQVILTSTTEPTALIASKEVAIYWVDGGCLTKGT